MDSTAVEIAEKINIRPDNYPDAVGFYNAIMDRLEGRRNFVHEMFYMVQLKQSMLTVPLENH